MNEKTILVSGAFNPLHFGHLLLFRAASKYGKVIVALNSDEWIIQNKGYLLFDFETRKGLLEECEHVSEVVPFDDRDGDAVYALFDIRPTYFGNGGSATSRSLPEVEMRVCEYLGIKPIFNLGDAVKIIDNNVLASAQKSIINHANKELNKLI